MPSLSNAVLPLAHLLIAVNFIVVQENVEQVRGGPEETDVGPSQVFVYKFFYSIYSSSV